MGWGGVGVGEVEEISVQNFGGGSVALHSWAGSCEEGDLSEPLSSLFSFLGMPVTYVQDDLEQTASGNKVAVKACTTYSNQIAVPNILI